MGKRTEMINRFAGDRAKATSAQIEEEHISPDDSKTDSEKRTPKTDSNKKTSTSKPSVKNNKDNKPDKADTANTSPKAGSNKKTSTAKLSLKNNKDKESEIVIPANTNVTKTMHSESVIDQLTMMGLQNSMKKPTTNACFSLDLDVLDGIKRAKDMYGIPLSRLVNTVLKSFLENNNIVY